VEVEFFKCLYCDGEGHVLGIDGFRICHVCHGTSKLPFKPCSRCEGTKFEINSDNCTECKGTGKCPKLKTS